MNGNKLVLNRRRLLGLGAASASTLLLAGCDQFEFLSSGDNGVRNALEKANDLTYQMQRLVVGQQALAHEYEESEIRQGQRPNGSTDPQGDDYLALKANNFADYRLKITGLVNKELSLSLADLRNMPSRTQITRHDCVEGWSCIAKWTGAQLGPVLDQAGIKPEARFCLYHCYDAMDGGLSGQVPYYETSDLIDAHHPQTILAYGMNNAALPVANGAPIRVRIERALGYKQPKYVHTIELVSSFAGAGNGKGGYWEDNGYDWYGGI
jgi:DMSO/TMAO reductase YedYZ molybdopterin-dependent catalytic subunit